MRELSSIRRARVTHECHYCANGIQPGQLYRRMTRKVLGKWTAMKAHHPSCPNFEDSQKFIVHQQFDYLVRRGRTVGIRLRDQSLVSRWYQVLQKFSWATRCFSAGPGWFVVSNGAVSGPFKDILESRSFLMS